MNSCDEGRRRRRNRRHFGVPLDGLSQAAGKVGQRSPTPTEPIPIFRLQPSKGINSNNFVEHIVKGIHFAQRCFCHIYIYIFMDGL